MAAKQAEEATKQRAYAKGETLRAILSVLESTSKAKGWTYKKIHVDAGDWRYATVQVSRLSGGIVRDTIISDVDVSVLDNKLQLNFNKTSFYAYGIDDLRRSVLSELKSNGLIQPRTTEEKANSLDDRSAPLDQVIALLRRFHIVAQQLRSRREGRQTLIINDEYDVQDLLNALLRGYFDDVRPEEPTPSRAGAPSRMDFLLKREKIVVETKMTTISLRDNDVGKQLIVDIDRYKSHPDCETLVCLVYDPGHFLKNPAGIENDLNGSHERLNVQVIVAPV